jgi:NO-binding membrane sensor protein with MHYT domain
MDMGYDLGLTLLSLAIAIAFTGAGLPRWTAPRNRAVGWLRPGLCMGLGVVAMHRRHGCDAHECGDAL